MSKLEQIESNEKEENTILIAKMMKDILNIINFDFKINVDKNSLSYERFLTHLYSFFQRVIEEKVSESTNIILLKQIEEQYPDKVKCARVIKDYVEAVINKKICDDEILYLSIYIVRLSDY